jgi:enoyl-CoA hydratase/carnithine racemase
MIGYNAPNASAKVMDSMSAPSAAARTASPAAPILTREDAQGIAILTLNRPAQRNALSQALLAALGDALAEIAADRDVRAVVIGANGPAFSSGHDLKELTAHRGNPDRGRAFFAQIMTQCSAVMQRIVTLRQPVIASVGGLASAAGCQLVASCDLAVASSAAGFCTPGVNIGLFCSTPMVALSRNVTRKQAMEMLLTGDTITAAEAHRIGLVNRVVTPGTERDEAIALARKIAKKSTHVLKIGKEAFYRQIEMGLADAYRYASEVMVENMLARDAEEGIGAFIEKRTPTWEDR